MAFVHDESCECVKSELDLFGVPPTQTSIEQGNWVEYHPLASINDGTPIEFDISGNGEDYIDLANTMLFVKAKIVKEAAADIEAADKVGPVNLFLHSLFSQVDISLNGTLVTQSANTYPYRAIIETLASYGQEAKKSHLTASLFYKDTANCMDVTDPKAATNFNDGLKKRRAIMDENKVVDMIGRIHADLFLQERYLLNQVNVRIKLSRSKDEFCLMGGDDKAYKVKIIEASLIARKVKLSPSIVLAHANALEHSVAKYPVHRVVCKTFTIPQGNLDMNQERLFSGQLPTRMIIGFVDNNAYNGNYKCNPFNFKSFSLTDINVYMDGQQQSIKPVRPDFANSNWIKAYMNLYTNTGKAFRDEGNFISREDFGGGYALYVFDLTPDLQEDDHFNLARQGSVRVEAKFALSLQNTVTGIAYAEFQNVIEIDRNRNVLYDFAS